MTYKEITEEVAKELQITPTLVDKVYKSYWRTIKEHIESLPLKEGLPLEELLKYKINVNLPSLGKLYVHLNKYEKVKNKITHAKDKED